MMALGSQVESITTAQDWLYTIGLASVSLVGAAFPFAVALIVAMQRANRVTRKLWFVSVSAAIAFGIATIFSVMLMPLNVFQTYLAPQLEVDTGGRIFGAALFDAIQEWWVWLELGVFVTAAIAVPLLLVRRIWPAIEAALRQ